MVPIATTAFQQSLHRVVKWRVKIKTNEKTAREGRNELGLRNVQSCRPLRRDTSANRQPLVATNLPIPRIDRSSEAEHVFSLRAASLTSALAAGAIPVQDRHPQRSGSRTRPCWATAPSLVLRLCRGGAGVGAVLRGSAVRVRCFRVTKDVDHKFFRIHLAHFESDRKLCAPSCWGQG